MIYLDDYTELKDKLNSFFKSLRKEGILARQNFTCCGTCGAYELSSRNDKAKKKSLGFVFYHRQDTERMEENKGVHLAFASFSEGEEEAMEDFKLGHKIVALAEKAGLVTEWNWNSWTRIWVGLSYKA